MRRRLVVVGPLPPPVHGVTVSTSLVLANPLLHERFEVEHLDTSDHRASSNIGQWDATNVALAVRNVGALLPRLGGNRGVVYLPLSQSAPGFLRDSLFVHAAAARRWKIAVHLRGSDFRTFYSNSSALLQRWIHRSLARVDSAGVMGSSLRWVFEGLVSADRIEVVPNGTPEPNMNGATRDPRTVLFLSNLRRRKGVVEALEAALLVQAEQPDVRFLFVGSWEDSELERRLRERAAAARGRIEFHPARTGRAKDVLLGSSSVLLFPPAEPEGHPRVVLEGLAAGLPVVATDRGAITETVIDGEHGFIVGDPEPKKLAEKLLDLFRDDELRLRMSRAARAHYLRNFTQAEADRRLAEWLNNLAPGPKVA